MLCTWIRIVARSDVAQGEGAVIAHLVRRTHRHAEIVGLSHDDRDERTGHRPAARVHCGAGNFCSASRNKREHQPGDFVADGDRHFVCLLCARRAGIVRWRVARAIVRRLTERESHRRGAQVVIARRQTVQAEVAAVVSRCRPAHRRQPAAAADVAISLRRDHDIGDRLAKFVGDTTADGRSSRQVEVDVLDSLAFAELERFSLLERPALAEVQGYVAGLVGGDLISARRQVANLPASFFVGRRRPAFLQAVAGELHHGAPERPAILAADDEPAETRGALGWPGHITRTGHAFLRHRAGPAHRRATLLRVERHGRTQHQPEHHEQPSSAHRIGPSCDQVTSGWRHPIMQAPRQGRRA